MAERETEIRGTRTGRGAGEGSWGFVYCSDPQSAQLGNEIAIISRHQDSTEKKKTHNKVLKLGPLQWTEMDQLTHLTFVPFCTQHMSLTLKLGPLQWTEMD